jgi:hypothetical protein
LAGVAIGMLICIGVVLLVAIAITVLFCLSMQRTLNEVRQRNRAMAPGMVWLYLIPLFNVFWAIYMVVKIAESLRNEFRDRGWGTGTESFGKTVGLFWSVGNVSSIFLGCTVGAVDAAVKDPAVSAVLNLVNMGVSLALLVCWIIYWVQIYQYGTRLREGERGYARGSIEEDYDEDYRRPRHDEEEYDRRDEDESRRPRHDEDDERGDYDDRRDRPRHDEH